jgi:hypothetical protein
MASDENPFHEPDKSPDDPAESDSFGPPKEPCLCSCLHCGREFMSDGIWYEKHVKNGVEIMGFWRCPTPNCGGAGFTFDIFPIDPDHPANDGWHYSDGDEQEWAEEEEDDSDSEPKSESKPYDPAEPEYAALDAHDDNIEGEEWKHGLAPGEAPPESPERAAARREWEAEQASYDAPDERPRVIDHTGEPDAPPRPPRPPRPPGASDDGGIDEGDIPF